MSRAHTLAAGDEESPEVPDGEAPTPGTPPGTSVASAPGADDASCPEGGGGAGAEGAEGAEGVEGVEGAQGAEGAAGAPKAEDELVLLPGLDGSIYVLGEGEEPQVLTEHTVQELVAAPTIFGEDGVLVGSKAVKLFAFEPRTGHPLYWQDSAAPLNSNPSEPSSYPYP